VIDEIVVVDNNSADATGQIAHTLGAKVVYEKVQGYGRAYKTGFGMAGGDIIVTLDGDMTYPVQEIPKLIKFLLENQLDFISCKRFPLSNPKAMKTHSKIGNFLLTLATNLLFPVRLRDSQSGMWVFRREVLTKIKLASDDMAFSEEIKIESFLDPDIKAYEHWINYEERLGNTKLRPLRHGLLNLIYLFMIKLDLRRADAVLKIENRL
jgi:glycosyltransferase involved in cell wall biosynthesis